MTDLRLIADDLTGALDSAAAFTSALGPLRVVWDAAHLACAGSLVIDSGTRECSAIEASARLAVLAPALQPAADRLCFFKVDSLLRGHAGRELIAVLEHRAFTHVLIAPAMPFQGRMTRFGRQTIRNGDDWRAIGEDIVATLRADGRSVSICDAGQAAPAGISFWNADSDSDLDAILSATQRLQGTMLFVGAAGLAAALARRLAAHAPVPQRLRAPLLGLIGTDHPVMQQQVAECHGQHMLAGADIAHAGDIVQQRLIKGQSTLVTCDLASGLARQAAEAEIARRFAALCQTISQPGCLFVSGGETFRALCASLGVAKVEVSGEFEPGIPLSRLIGGMWDGLAVISKSGAFGTTDMLARLVSSLDQPVKVCPT